jgi:D-sedoheptulose 7-phosphate isomerase
MVNDLIMARNFKAKSAQVISLTDNQAIFSAIGNDFSFEQVFSKQIETMCEAKDLLILISASGNSSNLIKAFEEASRIGMYTSAILGFDGGKLKDLVKVAVHAKTGMGDYGPAEDIALVVNHAIAMALRSEL